MPDLSTILATSNLVNALYSEAGQSENAKGQANAFNISAAGDTTEAGNYDTAAAIATQNAGLEIVSGQLQQFQNLRQLTSILGQQASGIAAGGLSASGSALDLARSSLQRGLLQGQVLGTNANLAAGGYYAQAAADTAQATAARTAASTASANASTASKLSDISLANASTTANFISQIPGAPQTLANLATPTNPATPNFSQPASIVNGKVVSNINPSGGPIGLPGLPISVNNAFTNSPQPAPNYAVNLI